MVWALLVMICAEARFTEENAFYGILLGFSESGLVRLSEITVLRTISSSAQFNCSKTQELRAIMPSSPFTSLHSI